MTRSRDVADTQDNLGGAVAPFVAGKNKIINGDFGIWQRGTSFSAVANVEAFSADRWKYNSDGSSGSITISQQTFSPGAAPVAGYEAQYFWRYTCTTARTSQTYNVLFCNLEDVRLFAGQTVTISFWAKSSSAVTLPAVYIQQQYGTGGSATTAAGNYSGFNVTTSWQRFTFTMNMPSISGKTIGTNSFVRPVIDLGTASNVTGLSVDIWGVQLEVGNVATPFTPAGGGFPGAELALCQRYFVRFKDQFGYLATGTANNSSDTMFSLPLPTSMRLATQQLSVSSLSDWYIVPGNKAISSFNTVTSRPSIAAFYTVSTGLSANQSWTLYPIGSGAYIDFSAEL